MTEGRNRIGGRLTVLLLPLVVGVGMALVTGRWWFLVIIAVGSVLYVASFVSRGGGRGSETVQRLAREDSAVGGSRLLIFLAPLLAGMGMALVAGRWWFFGVVAVGPILYAVRVVSRRRGRGPEIGQKLAQQDSAEGGSRLGVLLVPLLAGMAMAMITGRWWFLVIGAVGPILYVAGRMRRRRRRGQSTGQEPSSDVSPTTMVASVDEMCLKVGSIRLSVPSEGIVLGRRPGPSGVVVSESRVSRRHALVKRTRHGMAVADLGTTNGTAIVRGHERLPVGSDAMPLTKGDRIVTKRDVLLAEVVVWTREGESS